MEYWTDGNLVVNSNGGLNTYGEKGDRSWTIYRALNKIVLRRSGKDLLTLCCSYKKITELMNFFNKHKVHFTII